MTSDAVVQFVVVYETVWRFGAGALVFFLGVWLVFLGIGFLRGLLT